MPYESWASTDHARASMRGNRGRDTLPELALRRELHRLGLRYRVNLRPDKAVRGTADVVFTRQKIAVYVDGCFWHGCPDHYTSPKTNGVFWRDKVAGNITRDRRVDELLRRAGWTVIRIWEHEEPSVAAAGIAQTVRDRRPILQAPRPPT